MPSIDQRRLPRLVVLVAMLGMLGVVVADGWAARGATSGGGGAVIPSVDVTAGNASVEVGAGADATVDALARIADKATGEVAHGPAPSLGRAGHPADRFVFVQVAADQVRHVAQNAPALLVLAAVFAALAGARSVSPVLATAVARPLPLAHVRRRGPPAPAVV